MADDRMTLAAYAGFAVGAMLVLALASMPYGYYTLLRFSVFVVGGFIAYSMFQEGVLAGALGFGLLALLFNPLVPIYLTRAIWMPIDVVSALAFVSGSVFLLSRARRERVAGGLQ